MKSNYRPGELAPLIPDDRSRRSASTKWLYIGVGMGVLILLCIAGAVLVYMLRLQIPAVANIFTTDTPGPTSTFTPMPTSIPTSTSTPLPKPKGGEISGRMIWKTGEGPVSGAGIILCLVMDNYCTTDSQLTVITDSSGGFVYREVPPGKYVILYNPSGALQQSVKNMKIEINDRSASCLANGFFGQMPEDCRGSVPFVDDPNITLKKGSELSIKPTGMTIGNGSILSRQYDLTLDFVDGQPLSVEVRLGESVEITIRVWEE